MPIVDFVKTVSKNIRIYLVNWLTSWYLACQNNLGFALGDDPEDDELGRIRKRPGRKWNVGSGTAEH
jgi:hypothetical protein